MSRKKVIRVGIMPLEKFKQRTLSIVKGQHQSSKKDPKIWFPSIQSLARVLSEENQYLLKLIADTKPQSIRELEEVTGRKANNLLRTLRTMENYGLVKLIVGKATRGKAPLIPKVMYESATIEINFFKV